MVTVSEERRRPPAALRGQWIMAVDLGQSIDPTAIAVMQCQTRGGRA